MWQRREVQEMLRRDRALSGSQASRVSSVVVSPDMGNYKETPDSRGRELNLESECLQAFGQPSGSAGDVAFVEVAADHYTWWRQWGGARERNVGWRIDYVLASPAAMKRTHDAFIWPAERGSDHCPIGVDIDL